MAFSKAARAASVAKDITARFTIWPFSSEGRQCVLIVRPATQPNDAFMNAAFKLPSTSRPNSLGQMTVAKMKETAAEYVPLYARHIVVGWEHVYEDESPDVVAVFSTDKAMELLTALNQPPPDGRPDVFLDLRAFCANLENFRPAVVLASDLGKA